MTLFEYVAVAASLICSFLAVRLLGGVTTALLPEKRYWVHAAWVLWTLLNLSMQWWLFWSYNAVEWTYGRFLLALSPFCFLYLVGSLLIPSNLDEIESWRSHYYQVRVRVFALSIAALVAMVSCTVILLGHPLIHPRRILPGCLAVLFAVGLVSESPKVHAAIVIIWSLLMLAIAVVFTSPSSFGIAP